MAYAERQRRTLSYRRRPPIRVNIDALQLARRIVRLEFILTGMAMAGSIVVAMLPGDQLFRYLTSKVLQGLIGPYFLFGGLILYNAIERKTRCLLWFWLVQHFLGLALPILVGRLLLGHIIHADWSQHVELQIFAVTTFLYVTGSIWCIRVVSIIAVDSQFDRVVPVLPQCASNSRSMQDNTTTLPPPFDFPPSYDHAISLPVIAKPPSLASTSTRIVRVEDPPPPYPGLPVRVTT